MLNRKLMILAIFLVSLLAVSAVSAADNVTGDVVSVENQDNDTISEVENELISNEDVLNANSNTFTQLNELINGYYYTDTFYLSSDYAYNPDLDSGFEYGIEINRNITIYGNGHTIDGTHSARIFNVFNSNVILRDIIFTNGYTNDHGGAIHGECTVVNCTFINNTATGFEICGGAISGCSAINCTFIGNNANYNGGAINCGYAENCTFTDNSAGYCGGATYCCSALNCIFTGNHAVNVGGAMHGWDDSAINCIFRDNNARISGAFYGSSALNCTFICNNASEESGAMSGNAENCTFIRNYAGSRNGAMDGTAANCIFVNNTAKWGEGAMKGHAVNCTFINNTATNAVGALWGSAENCTFISNYADFGGAMYGDAVNCTFINNTAGGAAAIREGSAVNCAFIGNQAETGGAIMDCHVENCTFINNTVIYEGGAIKYGSIVNCIFIGNKGADGGAIYDCSAVENCTFINNTAVNDGGAIYWYSTYGIDNCLFINNTAESTGGAIFYKYGSCANNCTFIGNSAYSGGAINNKDYYESAVVNCTFINNTAIYEGGAMCMNSAVNCTFIGNSAEYGGAMTGGIYGIYWCVVDNCSFINNTARQGGAIHKSVANNCNFTNNTATEYGGAMYEGTAQNCLFNGNTAGIAGNNTYNTKMPNALLTANFISSSNMLFVNLTSEDDVPIADVTVTIRVYKNNASVGTYYCLSCTAWTADLNEGNYVAVLSVENNSYDVNPVNVTLNIKVKTEITSPDIAVAYNGGGQLIATLTNAATEKAISGANIVINLNDVNHRVKTNSKGQGTVSTDGLAPGTYTAEISYGGNSKYQASSTKATVVVDKAPTNISCDDISIASAGGELIATLTNGISGKAISSANIRFVVNDVKYTVKTNSSGEAKLTLSGLNPGTYTATVSYNGNSKYSPTNTTVNIVVNKITTSVSLYYDNATNELVATLINTETGKGISSANVVFNVDGKKTSVKTNKQGQARFSVSESSFSSAGVSYGGNSKYLKSTSSIKIVEGKIPTVISNVYDKENCQVTATLTNFETGKGISGATVVFNLNGKKSSTKTNKQGQAIFTVADLDPNVYSIGSSYGGNSKYAGSTTAINIVKV